MAEKKQSTNIVKYIWEVVPWVAVCLLLIIAAGLGLKIYRKKKQIKEEKLASYIHNRPPANVRVQQITPTEILDRIDLPATIAPWEDLTLLAEVRGTIISIAVKEGDSVKKGDLLAQIDPRDYKNHLNQAQASFDLAQADFNRTSRLAKMDATSQAQLDAIQARLAETSSALSQAKLDLERCRIIAPIAGFINKKFIQNGLLVSISDPLFQILDTHRVKIEVGIPESDVQAMSKLDEAEITIEALNNLKITGKKVFLSRQPESYARVYTLKLQVDNPGNLLRSGMFARVNLIKQRYPHSLVVPLYSVITNGDESYVYVVNNETAHYRRVRLGVLEGWNVQIAEGLNPNDRVVVIGQRNLEDGQKVNVIQ